MDKSEEGIVFLDLFSGIGGFHLGVEEAEIKIRKTYFSEIDKYAIANYKYNFPTAEHIGNIKKVNGKKLERPDLMTWGFPCQDISISGKGAGLKGKRSGLFFEAMRIAREANIKVSVFENVKNLLSCTDGKDFETVCEHIYISGFIFDFSVLDTKWFLPQNRERVYCIGYNIKYLFEIIEDKTQANKQQELLLQIIDGFFQHRFQKNIPDDVRVLTLNQYEWGLNQQKNKFLSETIISEPIFKDAELYSYEEMQNNLALFVSRCVTTYPNLLTQSLSTLIEKQKILIYDERRRIKIRNEEEIRSSKLPVSQTDLFGEDSIRPVGKESGREILPIGKGNEEADELQGQQGNTCTITTRLEADANGSYITECEFIPQDGKENRLKLVGNIYDNEHDSVAGRVYDPDGIAVTLKGEGGGGGAKTGLYAVALTEERTDEAKEIRKKSMKEGKDFSPRRGKKIKLRDDGNANTITSAQGIEQQIMIIGEEDKAHGIGYTRDKKGKLVSQHLNDNTNTLHTATGSGGNTDALVLANKRIRRLTPTECSRLQGFPDTWCKFGNFKGKVLPISDSQQYKMLGNAVSTPVSKAVALKIKF